MAESTDDVVVRLRLADVRKFIQDVKLGRLAIDDLEKKVSKVGSTAKKESGEYGGLNLWGATVGRMKYAVAGLALALGTGALALGTWAVKTTANLEQVEVGFKTLLGSQGAASKMIDKLQDFALVTPFKLTDLERQTEQLLAFGMSADAVIPSLTAMGDAVSAFGGSAADMDSVILAMGQIATKGVLSYDELRQLNEHKINAVPMLTKALGLNPQQLQKAIEARKIGSATAIPIILKGMESKYGGSMDAQSKTMTGIWSNIIDRATRAVTDRMNPLRPMMKAWLTDLYNGIPQIAGSISGALSSAFGLASRTYHAGAGIVSNLTATASAGGPGGLGKSLGGDAQSLVTGGLAKLGEWIRGVDWFEQGQGIGKQAVPFLLGLLSGLFDLETLWDSGQKHWLDMLLGLASIIGVGKVAGPIAKVLEKLPILKWFAPLFSKIDKLAGPLGRTVFRVFGAVGRAVGRAFERVFPETAVKIWYFFTRIKEIFDPKRLLGLFSKSGTFVIGLIERMFGVGFGIVKKILDGPFGKAIKDVVLGVKEMFADIWSVFFKPLVEAGKDALKAVFNWFAMHWNGVIGYIPGMGNLQIPLLAAGGTATQGGTAWVGEKGPELLNLPKGASVVPLPKIPDMGSVPPRPVEVALVVDRKVLARAVHNGSDDVAARR